MKTMQRNPDLLDGFDSEGAVSFGDVTKGVGASVEFVRLGPQSSAEFFLSLYFRHVYVFLNMNFVSSFQLSVYL